MTSQRIYANLAARVPPDVLTELHRLKATTGRSVNQLVVEALQEYLEKQRQGKAKAA